MMKNRLTSLITTLNEIRADLVTLRVIGMELLAELKMSRHHAVPATPFFGPISSVAPQAEESPTNFPEPTSSEEYVEPMLKQVATAMNKRRQLLSKLAGDDTVIPGPKIEGDDLAR